MGLTIQWTVDRLRRVFDVSEDTFPPSHQGHLLHFLISLRHVAKIRNTPILRRYPPLEVDVDHADCLFMEEVGKIWEAWETVSLNHWYHSVQSSHIQPSDIHVTSGLASHPAKGHSCGVHATGSSLRHWCACVDRTNNWDFLSLGQSVWGTFPHRTHVCQKVVLSPCRLFLCIVFVSKAPPPLEYVQHYQPSLLQAGGWTFLARRSWTVAELSEGNGRVRGASEGYRTTRQPHVAYST